MALRPMTKMCMPFLTRNLIEGAPNPSQWKTAVHQQPKFTSLLHEPTSDRSRLYLFSLDLSKGSWCTITCMSPSTIQKSIRFLQINLLSALLALQPLPSSQYFKQSLPCLRLKKLSLLISLDFSKAFDTV